MPNHSRNGYSRRSDWFIHAQRIFEIFSMTRRFFYSGALLMMLAWVSACSSLPNSTTETINQRRIEYALTQNNTIPVVFENGLSARMEWWQKVLPDLSREVTTFTYNRPGYGNSDPATTRRDGLHIVDELRALLKEKGLNPPYILVGHSLGGLYMQLFARLYPEEVSSLILVDSTHPKQLDGEGALEKQSFLVKGLIGVFVTGVAKDELEMLSRTGAQVLSLPALQNKPVFVLSASEPMKAKSALANDANAKRADIARLYPGSQQIWVDSGHGIPLEKPEVIVSAIRDALAQHGK